MSGVNDFAFKIGTVNGTGSASANGLLMQAIFRMGIPVSGKNIFPSNIQGLPTWYEIRVSKDGYTARPSEVDLVVALNPATYAKDVATVRPGGFLLYDSSWPLDPDLVREGITILGIPFGRMCVENFQGDRDRTLLRNIVYAGSLAALLGIDMDVVGSMLEEKYGKKPKLLTSNHQAIQLGYQYAKEHFTCPLPFHLEKMDKTGDSILIDGNTACALGAVYAGATVGAWYPITPATALMEQFKAFCERFRVDKETGAHNYAILQAEDELSAAGIIIGAGWMGARAFTNTSGPGISLMQEFIGLSYFAEVPAVIFDVQRAGPSTGMPTRTQQSDVLSAAYASHGDTKHVLLFPEDPRECFEFGAAAFDLADRLQTTIFVLLDLDIGMNDWLCEPFAWDDSRRMDRGKVMTAAMLDEAKSFGRYLDVDGDGIPYRTYPGTHESKGAFFTRGSSRDRFARYTEVGAAYVDNMTRLLRKFDTAKTLVPRPVERKAARSTPIGIIYYGSSAAAMKEALEGLQDDDIHLDALRIRAFPFHQDVDRFIRAHETVYVLEQNRDGQLRTLIVNECGIDPSRLVPVLHYDGTPITARFIRNAIRRMAGTAEIVPLRKTMS